MTLLLEDNVTFAEAAAQPNMPSERTLHRMHARRELPVVYIGRRPLIHVPSFRELLRLRELKVIGAKRQGRGRRG
jgi:hypothetical protein